MIEDELFQILSKRIEKYPLDRGADARELAANQKNYWTELLETLANKVAWAKCDAEKVKNSLFYLESILKNNTFCSVSKSETEISVQSRISLITDKSQRIIFNRILLNIPTMLLAGIVAENGEYFANEAIDKDGNYDEIKILFEPLISFFSNSYSIRAAQHDRAQLSMENVNKNVLAVEEGGKNISNIIVEAKERINDADNLIRKIETKMNESISAAEQRIGAIKALAHESASLNSATNIWKAKVRKHYTIFIIGIILLAGFSAALAFAILGNIDTLISHLPRKADGDIPYGALAILIIPLLAAIWVLRIAGRWISSAQTLAEDSEQRRAMLDTYFALVADETAKMEQSDRILILNAIFRPLPGHQVEDIAPPTLLDLASDAIGGKKRS